MQFLVNDLSLHGQFRSQESFFSSLTNLMNLRELALKNGRRIYCHRSLRNGRVTQDTHLPKLIGKLQEDRRRAFMAWLTKEGPFWEDARVHSSDEYLEYDGKVVTDTALGEAAFCTLRMQLRCLISFVPSDFEKTPLQVTHFVDDANKQEVKLQNLWESMALEAVIKENPIPLQSWKQLGEIAASRFENLVFAEDAFEPLFPHPFNPGVGESILERLRVLQELKSESNEDGARTDLGNEIYQEHFVGGKAWFSDSSETEKNDFKKELTFPHPETPEEELFCSWHGKIKTPQYRVHFNWPVNSLQPTYVVYVGPKLTPR